MAIAIPWAGVLIIKDRRVLTLKEFDKPFFIMPGGKLESGETDEDAAQREVLEELGAKVSLGSVFTEITEHSKNTGKLIRFKLFNAELLEELPQKLPGKTEKIAWIDTHHKKEGIDIGNFLIQLLPILVEKDLID